VDRKIELDRRVNRREFIAASGAICASGLFVDLSRGEALRVAVTQKLIWGLEPTFAVPLDCRFRHRRLRPMEVDDLIENIEGDEYELKIRRAADLLISGSDFPVAGLFGATGNFILRPIRLAHLIMSSIFRRSMLWRMPSQPACSNVATNQGSPMFLRTRA
jgi:hypothetical protein